MALDHDPPGTVSTVDIAPDLPSSVLVTSALDYNAVIEYPHPLQLSDSPIIRKYKPTYIKRVHIGTIRFSSSPLGARQHPIPMCSPRYDDARARTYSFSYHRRPIKKYFRSRIRDKELTWIPSLHILLVEPSTYISNLKAAKSFSAVWFLKDLRCIYF